tara:strand:+ start:215 stop:442 length:228 start_codon:yes stop_codon:yes gene_type:complete
MSQLVMPLDLQLHFFYQYFYFVFSSFMTFLIGFLLEKYSLELEQEIFIRIKDISEKNFRLFYSVILHHFWFEQKL